MKTLKISVLAKALLFAFSCKKEASEKETQNTASTEQTATAQKIVTLSGGITEIVSALGHEKEIIGTDVTSTFPASLKATATDLGHVRTMTVEPILALNPSLIIASEKDMNPDLLAKLKESGVKLELIQQEYSVQGTKDLITKVADLLGSKDAESLTKKIDEDLAKIKPIAKKPKVLFIYARGNNLMVAGNNTPMEKLIGIAGGENATNDFEDFKPLTPEAVVKANPDVLLFFSSGLESAGGIDGVLKVPGVSQTNAGKNRKIVALDGGLISSFGPRLGEAALALNTLLVENTK